MFSKILSKEYGKYFDQFVSKTLVVDLGDWRNFQRGSAEKPEPRSLGSPPAPWPEDLFEFELQKLQANS